MPIVFTRSNKVALLCLWVAIPVGFAQKVHTERDTSIDISKLKNFRFKERVRPPTDPLGAYPEAEGWVKESIEEELADRGISRLQSGDPDFWIRYDAATRQRTEKLAGSRISIAGFLHHYMEATLTVEFIDEHSERVLWSGRATDRAELNEDGVDISKKKAHKKIERAIRKMMKKLFKR